MNRLNVIFFPVGVTVILMHLLRNLHSVYYVFFGAVLLLFLVGSFQQARKRIFQKIAIIVPLLMFYIAFCSLLAGASEPILVGLFRLFYLSPVVIYFFSRSFDYNESMRFWRIIYWFIFASSCSIFIQYYIGPIHWFAESSERAGTERYASLAGSLTVFGALVGIGLTVSNFVFKDKIFFITSMVVLGLGAFLSLQKMAFLSLFLSIAFTWLGIFRKQDRAHLLGRLVIYIPVLSVILLLIYFVLDSYFLEHLLYFSLVFTDDAYLVGDVSVVNSMLDRFSTLPLEAINHWGYLDVLLGVGVFGGAGGLGYSELPMAHNLVVEVILIFGFGFGFIALLLLFKYIVIAVGLILRSSDPRVVLASTSFLILILTTLFSGGLFYHPVCGLIFWFSFSEIYRLNRNGVI